MMGMFITSLRKMARGPLGLDDLVEWPDDAIDEILNRSFWEIQNKFPFKEQEVTVKFPTVVGQASYEIVKPYDSLLGVSIEALVTAQHTPLGKIDPWLYEQEYRNQTDFQGDPQYYTHENCFIRLLPTPDTAYNIVMKRRINLTDLSNSNAISTIPQVWHEIIGYGAQWRLYQDIAGDIARATATRNLQASLINTTVPIEIKEKAVNTQYASMQPHRPEYRV
jgi:hypothetical protein